MRDVEFRGKEMSTGKWAQGSLIVLQLDETICRIADFDGNSILRVDPETVGEYTGLKDRNGAKIFEGDIISAYDGRIKNKVIFDRRGCMFGVYESPVETWQFSQSFLESRHIEVIGNIHDSPELLKEVSCEKGKR